MGAYGEHSSRLRNFEGFKLVTNLKETKEAKCNDISLIINGSFIDARAFSVHVLCPRLDKMYMKIYANSRYKDKSAQTVVFQSKHSS